MTTTLVDEFCPLEKAHAKEFKMGSKVLLWKERLSNDSKMRLLDLNLNG
jgi:hypothetical protein